MAADFRIDMHEQHRHRYYGRMGIYPKEVTDGASVSGNSSVLLIDPKFKHDLKTLYEDYV